MSYIKVGLSLAIICTLIKNNSFYRNEPKPKRNCSNYTHKATVIGYRGERDHFNRLEQEIANEFEGRNENSQKDKLGILSIIFSML